MPSSESPEDSQPLVFERKGVVFTTPTLAQSAVTQFVSQSEDVNAVMQTVVNFCLEVTSGIGCFDFRVRFNVPSCPDDFVCGDIEWIGF